MSHGWYTCHICQTHYHESEQDGDCPGCSRLEMGDDEKPAEDLQSLIIQTIRDKLTIDVEVGHEYGYYGERIRIQLKLDGEVISEDSRGLPIHH